MSLGLAQKPAVLLLSGGIDSVTALEIAKKEGYAIHALSFRYGQRHAVELKAVEKILERCSVQSHRVVDIDLRAFGGSALTSEISVPKSETFKGLKEEIPVTYVPARNTIFLSYALGLAETLQAYDIFIGVNQLDSCNYPDCRIEFIEAFERVANVATAAGPRQGGRFKIHAPLIHMNKAQIIRAGLKLGVDYSVTSSCYDPDEMGRACLQCDACHLRAVGFKENGIPDPAIEKQQGAQSLNVSKRSTSEYLCKVE
jgi:7-cyano-7-deazaguanine synthase